MEPINCCICGAIRWGNSRYLNKANVCKYCRKKANNLLEKGYTAEEVFEISRNWKCKPENRILKESE